MKTIVYIYISIEKHSIYIYKYKYIYISTYNEKHSIYIYVYNENHNIYAVRRMFFTRNRHAGISQCNREGFYFLN